MLTTAARTATLSDTHVRNSARFPSPRREAAGRNVNAASGGNGFTQPAPGRRWRHYVPAIYASPRKRRHTATVQFAWDT